MNLCTADPEARDFAASVLADDLRRMAALPGNFYNFHPGSHVGRGLEAAVEDISAALRKALKPGYPVTVLLAIGFALMGRVPVGRVVLAAVWIGHIIYFGFIVKIDKQA